MKEIKILNSARSMIVKAGAKLNRYSPEILIVVGVAGTVVSTIMACKATTKLDSVLDEAKKNVDAVHEASKNEELAEKYNDKDAKKDLALIYAQTGIKLVNLYTPAMAIGALSIVSILASNNILKKRNVALAAAYATVDKGFKDYRSRVVERFGQEVDKELRYNIKATQVTERAPDGETGTEKMVNVVDGFDAGNEYARFFDRNSRYWENTDDYNQMFLRAQQTYANNKLQANGFLYLNDVYDMLDIPKTKAGQIVGWIYDPKNPAGDNFVDFGATTVNRMSDENPKGYEKAILLDFNVDGNILDRM